MAEVFHETCLFYGRSPVPFVDAFSKLLVKLTESSIWASALLCDEISVLLGDSSCSTFCQDDKSVVVVFQSKNKAECVGLILKEQERLERLCKQQVVVETDDDEISNGSLLREALHQSLVRDLKTRGWISMHENILLHARFEQVQEYQPLETVSLDVQLESNDFIVLLVSPDVTCYHLAKPLERMSASYKRQFEEGKFVSVEDYCVHLGDMSGFECCVLPSMRHGYVQGFCKSPADGMDVELWKYVWKVQNGIHLPADHYYVRVCFSMDPGDYSWFPSCLVLTKAGLVPALPTLRCSKIGHVAEHLMKDVAAWRFLKTVPMEFKALEKGSTENPLWSLRAKGLTATFIEPAGIEIAPPCGLEPQVLQKSLRARPSAGSKTSEPGEAPVPSVQLVIPSFTRQKGVKLVNTFEQQKSKEQEQFKKRRPSMDLVQQVHSSPTLEPQQRTDTRTDRPPQSNQSEKPGDMSTPANPSEPSFKPREDKKRSQAAGKKQARTSEAEPDMYGVEALITRKHCEGKLKDMTMTELKNFLRLKKAKVGGKKEEIIRRIQAML